LLGRIDLSIVLDEPAAAVPATTLPLVVALSMALLIFSFIVAESLSTLLKVLLLPWDRTWSVSMEAAAAPWKVREQ
jgi:hypothetical protein